MAIILIPHIKTSRSGVGKLRPTNGKYAAREDVFILNEKRPATMNCGPQTKTIF